MSKVEDIMYEYLWKCRVNAEDHKVIEDWIAIKRKHYGEVTNAADLFETYHACSQRVEYIIEYIPDYQLDPEYWHERIEREIIVERVSNAIGNQH